MLAALVLIFAVACSGDNPSPAETPAVNTSGATQSDIRRYADIASSLMTQMVPLDDELRTLFFQNAGREHVTISNEAGTFSFTGSVDSDGFPSGCVAKLDGYSFLVTEADGRTTRTTTWGEFTSAGKNGTYDFTIRLDDEGKTFEYYKSDAQESVNGIDVDGSGNGSGSDDEDSGTGQMTVNPPQSNTQDASEDELKEFASIGVNITNSLFTSEEFKRIQLEAEQNGIDYINDGRTLSVVAPAPPAKRVEIRMNGYPLVVNGTRCTIWGDCLFCPDDMLMDLTVRIDEGGRIFTFQVTKAESIVLINGQRTEVPFEPDMPTPPVYPEKSSSNHQPAVFRTDFSADG